MDRGKMAIHVAVVAVVVAVMCAPSTAEPSILTHRMVGRTIPSGWVGSTIDQPPYNHPDYVGRNGRYRLFDRMQNKAWTVETRAGQDYVFVEYKFPKLTKVKKYRIIVDPAGDPNEYPRSWTLYGTKQTKEWSREGFVELHKVENYAFTGKATPLLKLTRRGKFRKYYLEITEDGIPNDGKVRVTMTEIKLMGNLNQFDDPEFPGGAYPCSKTLDILTKKDGKGLGTPFSTSSWPSWPVEQAFDQDGWGWLSALRPNPPAIIGYEFNEPTTVQMYRVFYNNGPSNRERAPREFEFQGSFCDSGCDRTGDDGWVTLDTVTGHRHNKSPSAWDGFDQFVVSDAAAYKAYRLRITKDNFTRSLYPEDITAVHVGQFVLMGCKA